MCMEGINYIELVHFAISAFLLSLHAAVFPCLEYVLPTLISNSKPAQGWVYLDQAAAKLVEQRRLQGNNRHVCLLLAYNYLEKESKMSTSALHHMTLPFLYSTKISFS